MTKTTMKFTSGNGSKLTLYAKPGKKGFHVGATLKHPGQPAQTGCRSTVSTEAEATKAFHVLKTEAAKNGWTEVVRKDRNAFTAIPQAKKTAA